MRLFLVLGLMVGIFSTSIQAQDRGLTPDEMCAALKNETGETFQVTTCDGNKVTLQSTACERMVCWYFVPELVLKQDQLELCKRRVDNLGQGNFVYVLSVEGRQYYLFLNAERVVMRSDFAQKKHVDLIKAWVTILNQVENVSRVFMLRHQGA